jgi:hypothetical protein
MVDQPSPFSSDALVPSIANTFQIHDAHNTIIAWDNKNMEELEMESFPAAEGRIPMTSVVVNTVVGYLEDYAELILPANL